MPMFKIYFRNTSLDNGILIIKRKNSLIKMGGYQLPLISLLNDLIFDWGMFARNVVGFNTTLTLYESDVWALSYKCTSKNRRMISHILRIALIYYDFVAWKKIASSFK